MNIALIESFSTVWSILLILFGVGMLIFVHEFGHFIMAKKHKVRVDAFSLGMGPVLFRFKKGETEYRLSLIPLGGYVSMPGELPSKDRKPEEYELCAKKPWQRFQVFVAGALINLIVAFPICVIAFMAGRHVHKPIVGTPGTAEAAAGMLPGDTILSIEGRNIDNMDDYRKIMLGILKGTQVSVQVQRGNETKELKVEQLGSEYHSVTPVVNLIGKVDSESPAKKAGLLEGDEIIKVNDITIIHPVMLSNIVYENPGKKLSFTISRTDKNGVVSIKTLEVDIPKKEKLELPVDNSLIEPLILAVSKGSPAALAKLKKGDKIKKINGKEIKSMQDLKDMLKSSKGLITIEVERAGKPELFSLTPSYLSIGDRAIGIEYLPSTNIVADVRAGSFYEKAGEQDGLKRGDKIVSVDNRAGDVSVSTLFSRLEKKDPVKIVVQRDGKEISLNFTPKHKEFGDWETLGIHLSSQNRFLKRWGFIDAMKDGISETIGMIGLTFNILYKLFAGHESVEGLAGPVGVAHLSYEFTKIGIGDFLWLLALFTVNLGVLNLLPIPVLDGGHVLLLLIEQIRGKPPGEKFIMAFQLCGLALILLLLVFATYNDIGRLVTGRF